jgi:hypothetical protein
MTHPRLLAATLVSWMLLFASCGGSSSPAAGGPPSVAETTTPQRMRVARVGHPGCSSARAFTGPQRGEIEFVAKCWASSRGQVVGFSLASSPLKSGGSAPDIKRFDRHPASTGRGAVKPYGVCRPREKALLCSARAHGPIEISGAIHVSPAIRCSISITITVVVPPRCAGNTCPADLATEFLYRGKPRGC